MGEGFKWKYRHAALAALFIVWLVSYMDRMVMATAIPYIAKEFSLTPVAVGGVLSAYFFGYASFQIIGGILADRYGARKVMIWAIVWWSAFTAFTGMVGSLVTMLWVRALFGMGEGVAPAATWKACAIWSPAKDRAWTSGLMLCSNCLGPALAPLFVAAVMATVGWRGVFYSLTIPGLLLAWWIWYNLPDNPADKKGITAEELEELKEDIPISAGAAKAPVTNLTFWQILRQEAVWKSFGILFFNNMVAWVPGGRGSLNPTGGSS
jgi:MFS family permease